MIAGELLGRLRAGAAGRFGQAPRAAIAAGRPTVGRRRPWLQRRMLGCAAALVALTAVAAGAWLWVRDSSLVAVEHVTVTGESGPDATQIRSALVASARSMTTLDVRMDQLRMSVAPYPVVKELRVSTQFPHGMRVRVIEQIPVGAVVAAGRTIPVAGDGTLLHDVAATSSLPVIPLRVAPGGPRVTDRTALAAVGLLAAAPSTVLTKVSQVTSDAGHGLTAQLRAGPSVYFGDPTRLSAKWIAALAVLADQGSAGATYIDVTDPQRPAAGTGNDAGGSAGAGASTASDNTSSNPGGTSPSTGG